MSTTNQSPSKKSGAMAQYDVQLFESEDLPFGIHILRARVNGTKHPSSTSAKVAVDLLSLYQVDGGCFFYHE